MELKKNDQNGLSRIEVFFLVAIPILFLFIMLPCTLVALGNSQRRAMRISCSSNLKQINLSMHLFANDHEGGFPWMVSTNSGGSMELTNPGMAFRHFSAASNELATAKVLSCIADWRRQRASTFEQLSNTNLSYFISLDARPHQSNSAPPILAGDRNILGGTALSSSLRIVRKSDKLSWSKEIHGKAGNIALVDGSVLQVDAVRLNNTVSAMTNAAIRLAIP